MNYLELPALVAPEIVLAVTALLVLLVDLGAMREEPLPSRLWVGGAFAGLGCIVAAAWILVINPHGQHPMFANDPLTHLVQVGLLVMAFCAIILSTTINFTEHAGEYLALLLLATTGMMLLVASRDLLMIFLSLELTSLPLYVLTAFNKRKVQSVEAGLKYYLFGGVSAAFALFGLSLVYGLGGSTNLNQIATSLAAGKLPADPLWMAALVMTIIGFAFKIAAAPFHLWAPDVYEGAPAPGAALIASGSKLAGFYILGTTLAVFSPVAGDVSWLPVIVGLSVASMLLGNLAAIAQTNVRRLLAYSAIANTGYALLGILANSRMGMGATLYYMFTYGLAVIGAFGVVAVVENRAGRAKFADFAGLSRRDPVLAFCLLIFVLALAGIPPLPGFIGKFYLFMAVLKDGNNPGMLWLVVLALMMSAVSLYYYLRILKQIYIFPAPEDAPAILVPPACKIILLLLAVLVIAAGCLPDLLLSLPGFQ